MIRSGHCSQCHALVTVNYDPTKPLIGLYSPTAKHMYTCGGCDMKGYRGWADPTDKVSLLRYWRHQRAVMEAQQRWAGQVKSLS